jgi:hypothetical protein
VQACPVQPRWTRPFPDRLLAVLRFDPSLFQEVERDHDAIGQAVAVVVLAALAQGLGGLQPPSIPALIGGLIGIVVMSVVGWLVTTGVIWAIGVKLMSCSSDFGALLRTLGFATAPKILFLFGVLPLGPFAVLLGFAVLALTTVASVLAVRQTLDVTTGRAILICVLGMVTSFLLAVAVATVIGIGLGVSGLA